MDLPGLGLHNVLVVPNEHKGKQHVEGSAKFLRVVHAGDIYQIVNNIHVDKLKHSEYKNVLEYAQRHYHGITRGFIQEYRY